MNSTVSNAAESTAAALFGATGMSIAGIVATNRVSSAARAYIEDTDGEDAVDTTVNSGGNLTVLAMDEFLISLGWLEGEPTILVK